MRMRQRCRADNVTHYSRYAGRGISVCERWESFPNFLADMGEAPDGMSLDRIDNDRGYEPGNCRWATPKMQQRNTRLNVNYTIDGETKCFTAWCEHFGLHKNTVLQRLRYGWPPEKAFKTPPLKTQSRYKRTPNPSKYLPAHEANRS
jgi:hypothetical protein